jgi:hypothetical protein
MARKIVDWEALATHYRAGIRSLKDIGKEFGVSDAAIVKRAKRDGWSRDLKAKIRAKAEAKVSAATVSAEVSAERAVTEELRIEVESEVQSRVRLAHRRDIGRNRTLSMAMLAELEQITGNVELFQQLGSIIQQGGEGGPDGKALDAFYKTVSLNGRIDSVKKLAETIRVLVGLERQAFGIDVDESEKKSTVDQAILDAILADKGEALETD